MVKVTVSSKRMKVYFQEKSNILGKEDKRTTWFSNASKIISTLQVTSMPQTGKCMS